MNKVILCVFVISLILSISIYFYNFCSKNVSKGDKVKLSEFSKSGRIKILQENRTSLDNFSDEDVKYLHDKGWAIHQVNNRRKSRNTRSLSSIANCLWRVLNYPYMYNFYPILNFGVSKIMTGLGDLINNVHFPLFSTASSSTSQAPLSDSELQAQQLAYAQGQTLSQEVSTLNDDTVRDTSSINIPTKPSQIKTSSPDYQYSSDQDDENKEREEKLKEEEKMREVDKKINEKAAILAKKYVQLYFSQNKQQLSQDDLLSKQNNLADNSVQLPSSIENELQNPTTELYDFNTV